MRKSLGLPNLSHCAVTVLVLAVLLTGCSGGGGAPPVAGPTPTGTPTTTPSAVAAAGAETTTSPPPRACTIFPADNIWHADVSRLPVHRQSAAYVASIGAGRGVHADFGAGDYDGGPIGIPVTDVPSGQAGVKVSFEYASESDKVAYPIPRNAAIEGGPRSDGDRHIILYDKHRCRAYELYAAYPRSDGTWRAGSGAVFDLRRNGLRPRGWPTSTVTRAPGCGPIRR